MEKKIWQSFMTVEILNSFSVNTMGEHLGIVFTEIGDDYLLAEMPVDHRTRQPAGLLHGGASVALAETLGSVAGFFTLKDPQKYSVVGVEINANHLKAVTSGKVTGKVTPVRIGKNIQVWNIEIKNDKEQLVCISRLTTMTVKL